MTKFVDLSGKKFGKWNVIKYMGKQKYLCRCDCGTEKIVNAGNLRDGKTTSCGCVQKRIDYTGMKIDRLTVLRKLPLTKSYVEYECQCDCGNKIIKSAFYLKSSGQKCCPDCRKPNIEDLSGQRFGKLTVIKYAGKSQGKQTLWECQCDCGNTVIVHAQNIKSGHTVSCGCYNSERARDTHLTHGEAKTRLYGIWNNMNYRCSSPKHDSYYLYGGKGIKVCEEWKNSFENFRDWSLQNGYKDGLSIDRIDSDKDYCPDNCRWVSDTVQANNTSRNRVYTIKGVTDTLANWCKKYNISYAAVSSRVLRGWDIVDALSKPINKNLSRAGK